MEFDHDRCYEALRSRDRRFDGRFFTAVISTGVYCRPICPARTPRPENVRFYRAAAAAEADGFRACLRCRPEVAPSTPAWSGTAASVARGLALIEEGGLDSGDVDSLARRLGVGSRHLRRLFIEHLGVPPLVVARSRRAHAARLLIEQTDDPMTEIAGRSGFSSLRRFNRVMRETFGVTPSQLRAKSAVRDGSITVRLAYRPPFDWAGIVAFLRARATPGVERFDGPVWERLVSYENASGVVRVMHDEERFQLVVSIPIALRGALVSIGARVRRVFDLGADPAAIALHFDGHPALRVVSRRHPGVRVPGAWDPFEIAVRAVVGQQVSVQAATTIMKRIVERFGEDAAEDAAHNGGLRFLFPSPERLAAAELNGMPARRCRAVRALAAAVAESRLSLGSGHSLEETLAALRTIPGIGDWTAQYIAMRGMGEPDAFPAGDLILRRAAGQSTEKELIRAAEPWRPWRAYAAMLLWKT